MCLGGRRLGVRMIDNDSGHTAWYLQVGILAGRTSFGSTRSFRSFERMQS